MDGTYGGCALIDIRKDEAGVVASKIERICVLVDNNSLMKATGGRPLDFNRLRSWLVGPREAAVARFYCGELQSEVKVKGNLYHSLGEAGFRPVIVKNPRSSSRSAEDDPDISGAILAEIAWDMCELISMGYYDALVLVTGSFSLATIVTKARARGIRVEVAFPKEACSPTLWGRASKFRAMDTESLVLAKRSGS